MTVDYIDVNEVCSAQVLTNTYHRVVFVDLEFAKPEIPDGGMAIAINFNGQGLDIAAFTLIHTQNHAGCYIDSGVAWDCCKEDVSYSHEDTDFTGVIDFVLSQYFTDKVGDIFYSLPKIGDYKVGRFSG